MRRDPAAIALYIYLALVLFPQTFRIGPTPAVLVGHPTFFTAVTTGSLWVGCCCCAIGRFWKDELDGGAIEQIGISTALLGWLLYIYAFAQLWPVSVFGLTLCVGFTIVFTMEWWLIRRWRRTLRTLAGIDGHQ